MSATARTAIGAATMATIAGAAVWAGPVLPTGGTAVASDQYRFQVLVYSRTAGFRHISIEPGVQAIRELGDASGFRVVATEDPTLFKARSLSRFKVVVFLNTTGTVLDRRQKTAFRRYIRRGGGYVGIHSAADTEHDWRFYDRLVGALFRSHPLQQLAWFDNEAPDHPATAHLDSRFLAFDEFYSFKRNPRRDVRVLLTIDEGTYFPDPNTSDLPGNDPPASGYMGDHPMSWCHRNLGGRAFYTALGHEPYLYETGWYRRHILGGILTTAGQGKANCRAGSNRGK